MIDIINFCVSFDLERYLPLINSKITLTIRKQLKDAAAISVLPPGIWVAAKIAKIGMIAFQELQRKISEIIKAFTMEFMWKSDGLFPIKISFIIYYLAYHSQVVLQI